MKIGKKNTCFGIIDQILFIGVWGIIHHSQEIHLSCRIFPLHSLQKLKIIELLIESNIVKSEFT